jgi:hypothetical protein
MKDRGKKTDDLPSPKRGAFPTPRNVLAGATPYLPAEPKGPGDPPNPKPDDLATEEENIKRTETKTSKP